MFLIAVCARGSTEHGRFCKSESGMSEGGGGSCCFPNLPKNSDVASMEGNFSRIGVGCWKVRKLR